jgi:hypothetical protein
MPNVSLEFTPEHLDYLQQYLGDLPSRMSAASRDTLNRSLLAGRTVAAKRLSEEMTVAQGAVKKRLNMLRATSNRLSAVLYVRGGRGPNLIGFGARLTATGVSVRVFGKRREEAGAFIAPGLGKQTDFNLGANGPKVVFKREGSKRAMAKGRYAGRKIVRGPRAGQPVLRQPLKSQYGPSVAETFQKTPGVEQQTLATIEETKTKNLEQQVRYQLSRK